MKLNYLKIRKTKNLALIFSSLLFFVVPVDFYGQGKKDVHIFKNISQETYNDLHIVYTKTVSKAKLGKITGGSGNYTAYPDEKTIDVKGEFPPGSSITITASANTKSKFKIKNYWWTIDEVRASSIIPVYYFSKKFKKTQIPWRSKKLYIKKPPELVQVQFTKGKLKMDKTAGGKYGKNSTTVRLRGTVKKNEIISGTIDPPDDIIDFVLDFSKGSNNRYVFPGFGVFILLVIVVFLLRKKK